MSMNSKARRDARKKKEPKRAIRRLGSQLQPHAQLETADDNTIGGAGFRDGEWFTVLGSQVVARTPSAAMTLAMLRHIVAVQEQAGQEVRLTYSPAMEAVAMREAAALGQSLEDYLQILEQERLERSAMTEAAENEQDDSPVTQPPAQGNHEAR